MSTRSTKSLIGLAVPGLIILLTGCTVSKPISEPPGASAPVPDRQIGEKSVKESDGSNISPADPSGLQTQKPVDPNSGKTPNLQLGTPRQEIATSATIIPAPIPSDPLRNFSKDLSSTESIDLNTTTLTLQGPGNRIGVGDQFTLSLNTEQVNDLFSAPFYLQYDPQQLEFIGLIEGDFLKRDKNPTAFIYTVEPEIGKIIVGLSRLGEVNGISGSGTLVIATFKARTPGTAKVTLQNVDFRDARLEPVPVTYGNGEVQIR